MSDVEETKQAAQVLLNRPEHSYDDLQKLVIDIPRGQLDKTLAVREVIERNLNDMNMNEEDASAKADQIMPMAYKEYSSLRKFAEFGNEKCNLNDAITFMAVARWILRYQQDIATDGLPVYSPDPNSGLSRLREEWIRGEPTECM